MRRATYKYRRPLSEAVNGIAKFDLVYEPGTKFIYSGAGHCVAGRVAEVALGDQSLEKIAQDVLFRPLGLNRTTYLPSQEARKAAPPQYLSYAAQQKYPMDAQVNGTTTWKEGMPDGLSGLSGPQGSFFQVVMPGVGVLFV
jgi:CubicO group peptidase (beta-lactamase class C family)